MALSNDTNSNNGYVRCSFNDCHKCCLETQMLLTESDLKRIESLGYSRQDFCLDIRSSSGFLQLKNIHGRCFFLTEQGKCSIYDSRPAGCKVYPLVYELSEEDILIDDDCREVKWFVDQKYSEEQIQHVKKLAHTLLEEQERHKNTEFKDF